MLTRKVNGEEVELTAEEIAAFQAGEDAYNSDAAVIERKSDEFQKLAQRRLDEFAATKKYDSCLSCCTYENSLNQTFAAEAVYMIGARDATWTTLYQILADVLAGQRAIPADFAEIEGELPVLAWP